MDTSYRPPAQRQYSTTSGSTATNLPHPHSHSQHHSPYNPSPTSHPQNTSPHSSSNVSVSGQGQNNNQPSPLGPTYLTRYPNLTESLPTSQITRRLSTSTVPALASDTDMYGRGSTDGFPASWAPGPGARDNVKDERPWPTTTPATAGSGSGSILGRHNSVGERMFGNGNGNGNGTSGSGAHRNRGHIHGGSVGGSDHGGSKINQPSPAQSQGHQQSGPGVFPSAGPTAKRGSRACVACRKGKNRCEWDPSGSETVCRRCLLNGTPCVFEKASEKGARTRNESVAASETLPGEAEHRVSNLERTVQTLAQSQDQIQNTLQQILSMLPNNQQSMRSPSANNMPPSFLSHHRENPTAVHPSSIFPSSVSPPSIFSASGQHPVPGSHSSTAGHSDVIFQTLAQDRPRSPQNTASGPGRAAFGRTGDGYGKNRKEDFPALPGFAPPNHQFGTYGIIPLPSAPPSPSRSRHSSRSSSSHSATSSSALPHETLTAPIQALQALAHAADQAAAIAKDDGSQQAMTNLISHDDEPDEKEGEGAEGEGADAERGRTRKRKRVTIDGRNIHLRVRKKKRPDPTPRNPFPDVVTKGLVSETEARELWDIFFSGCHYFVPLWDKSYDTYETFMERTPFSTNGLLAVAAKIRAGNGPLGQTFHRCLEEAQGIARSTLFGPIVRKEAVMAMLILSVWSQNGWLPCGHALRMGLDMNLHRALDKLANKDEVRTDYEERDLVVSARIWLNCYMHEHLVSLGTGKPLLLRDDSSVHRARDLLDSTHPMASETDMRLIAGVELVNLRIRILEHLTPLHGKVDNHTIAFVKRMLSDLQGWHREWHAIHRQRYEDDSVLVKLLETELLYAQLWTVCVALRGVQWDKLSPDQRELAFQAKDAALRCLEIFLCSDNFRRHLKYATHDQLVSVAFAAVFLLKIAILFPSALSLPHLISQVSQLAHLLSAECFAERYALTLRLMLSNFRRKTGAMSTVPGTPRLSASAGHGHVLPMTPGVTSGGPIGDLDGGLQSLLALPQMDGMDSGAGMNGDGADGGAQGLWDMMGLDGFDWPTEFSPSALPVWLQDNNFTDLGLPADGSDSLFLPLELANMFLPSGTQSNAGYQFTLPDSGDVGAEAW
ncbi:hypothetical protein IAR55_000752 [Kwoniella newhampshirensis]|uniref:Zn(2)-C6 fungal-type domain-containing protein n=1 Tax=Kwoniella newhampshirensis TaxID=1651941 RepID=A0AAW0Z3Z0_9TREE